MSIRAVVLFISSTSSVCAELIRDHVSQSNLPISLVRLDTRADRERAMHGKDIQITAVPTLLVGFTDGRYQLFTGKEKIGMWIDDIRVKMSSKPPSLPPPPSQEEEEEYEEPPPPRRKAYVPENDGMIGLSPSIKKKKKLKTPKKKRSSKKAVHFSEDEGEEDIEFIDAGIQQPHPSTIQPTSLSTAPKPPTGMSDLKEMAERMQRERDAQLGGDPNRPSRY